MRNTKLRFLPAMVALAVGPAAPAQPDQTARWREDLAFLARELPARHIDFFHALDKAEFEKSVAQLHQDIETLDDRHIAVRLARLVALAGDSHTALNPIRNQREARIFPLALYWFDDGIRVLRAPQDLVDVVGGELLTINDKPIEDILQSVATVLAAENQAMIMQSTPLRLTFADILYGLDIIDDSYSAEFGFTTFAGVAYTTQLTAVPSNQIGGMMDFSQRKGYQLPLYIQYQQRPYWLAEVEDADAVFLQYNRCASDPRYPFAKVGDRAIDMMRRLDQRRLIVDLRHNGGGDSRIADPFIDKLAGDRKLCRKGRIFVIIGRQTFSSAILNALALQDKCGAILVGEETGGKPNHFGELKTFTLPNSALTVQYSTKYFKRRDKDVPTLSPDIEVKPTWKALAQGVDPALQACLEYENEKNADPSP